MTDIDKEQVRFCGWCAHIDTDHRAEPCSACGKWNRWANYEPAVWNTPQSSRDRVAELQADARKADEWKQRIADFAERIGAIVNGERSNDYGRPRENHERTAAFWRLYLYGRFGVDVPLDGLAVCALNRLQKESRMCKTPDHYDSLVDVGGFAANSVDCIGGDDE